MILAFKKCLLKRSLQMKKYQINQNHPQSYCGFHGGQQLKDNEKKKACGNRFSHAFFLLCVERMLLHKHLAALHDVDARLETIDVVGHLDT